MKLSDEEKKLIEVREEESWNEHFDLCEKLKSPTSNLAYIGQKITEGIEWRKLLNRILEENP